MRHRQTLIALLLSPALLLGPQALSADTLEMPQASTERQLITLEMPAKGMHDTQVADKFGEPLEKVPAVGKPPIGRWVYEQYTVYFEGRYVIHSVLNK